ncbi:MAG: alanine--tRNA ligase [archaeon]
MPTIKELKGELKKKTDKNPEKYYPIEKLKEKGFQRSRCRKCGKYFWVQGESELCGDPECSGQYTFINDSPCSKKMDFIKAWQEFSKLFKKLGYTPIRRYPVVARWRDDTYWTNASIYDFQPHVVSGLVEPPANPLVVPQVCVRFNDIDNVGITGRHYTSFVMIGQHAFVEPGKKFDKNKYLSDIMDWLETGMGLPLHEVKFHEDQWGGGGNLGVCMEFFARGLEIGNQVYMQYQVNDDGTYKDLDLKVLDMGMGQERCPWMSMGTATSYEVNFPTVVKKLYKETGIKANQDVLAKFLPYSGLLDMEEAKSIDVVWKHIADKISMDVKDLKQEILPLSGLYSIGDHTRTLLFAITDGAIPSNVGGAYNLRVVLRRALGFIDEHGWDNVSLYDTCREHAAYLKPQYPELSETVENLQEILEVEEKRYKSSKIKSARIVTHLLDKGFSDNELVSLYDSNGISPEMLKEAAKKLGKKIETPEDFYSKVAARHPEVERERKKENFDVSDVPPTEILYYKQKSLEFDAKVLKVINKKNVVLDRTVFFPTGGGQEHDTGLLNNIKVTDVTKAGGGTAVVHTLEKEGLKKGDKVHGTVDKVRRLSLSKLHTAAHIVGGAARKVLGNHIWQAGSQIDPDKGRLDITHYQAITEEERAKIEKLANEIIRKGNKITKEVRNKKEAEKNYGFTLYQGGAIPGKDIRVVEVCDWDVQACAGTHLDNASDVEGIRLIKTEKIQDGVVRLVFIAGKQLLSKKSETEEELIKASIDILKNASPNFAVEAAIDDIMLGASIFKVNSKQLPVTLQRFLNEVEELGKTVENGVELELEEAKTFADACRKVFNHWKLLKKEEKKQKSEASGSMEASIEKSFSEHNGRKIAVIDSKDIGLAMQVANVLCSKHPNAVILISAQNRTILLTGKKANLDAKETLNTLIPNSKISGDKSRAVSDKSVKGADFRKKLKELIK